MAHSGLKSFQKEHCISMRFHKTFLVCFISSKNSNSNYHSKTISTQGAVSKKVHCTKTHLEILSIKGRWWLRIGQVELVQVLGMYFWIFYVQYQTFWSYLSKENFQKSCSFSQAFLPDQNITYLHLKVS